MGRAKPVPATETPDEHNERMRRKDMRLVKLWLPDVATEEFKAEARRQSLLISRSPHAKEDQAFTDSITIKWWEDEE